MSDEETKRTEALRAEVVAKTRRGERATPAEMRAAFPEQFAEDSDEAIVAFQRRVHGAADALAHAFAHGEVGKS